jgi:hypothetical protein
VPGPSLDMLTDVPWKHLKTPLSAYVCANPKCYFISSCLRPSCMG